MTRRQTSVSPPAGHNELPNTAIAELLALAAETAKMPLQKALRRASRKALFWPEEAALLYRQGRSLEELPGVGPSLSRIIVRWIEDPPKIPIPPTIRQHFLTLPEARAILARKATSSPSPERRLADAHAME